MKLTSLRLGFWNGEQVEDNTFLKEISDFDIIGLAETKHTKTSYTILDYLCYPISRKKSRNTTCISGGLMILIKPCIKPGVKLLKCTSEYQWLLLDKSFF